MTIDFEALTASLTVKMTGADCACALFERCEAHVAKMKEIHAAWNGDDNAKALAVEQYADGYDVEGFVPDWSGIRDSSPIAIDRMHAALRCPAYVADADECAMVRERSVAGVANEIPECPVHGAVTS